MSITRKALAAMGIEEEKVDEIIKMHLDTVNPIKDERDTLKADADKLAKVQGELDELKKSIKDTDRSPYKAKYEEEVKARETLQSEFDTFKADLEAKNAKAERQTAYRKLLTEAGVSEKRIDSVLRLAEVDGKLDNLEIEDGKVKGDDVLTDIKETYADYIVSTEPQGANTPKPPSSNVPEVNTPSAASLRAKNFYTNLYGGTKEE